MAMLPIRVFGNTTAAARATSALTGALSVLLLVSIVHSLSHNSSLSLISGFVLATAPWHLLASRDTLEANLALFFTLLGLALFLRSRMITSGFFFALSLYAYHTQWGYTPLLIIILVFFIRKRIVLFLSVFLLTILPLATDFLNNRHNTARSSTQMLWTTDYVKDQFKKGKIHGLSFFASGVLGNYSDYLNPGWLFFSGFQLFEPNDAFNQGLFLQVELAFLIIGLTCRVLFRKKAEAVLYIVDYVQPHPHYGFYFFKRTLRNNSLVGKFYHLNYQDYLEFYFLDWCLTNVFPYQRTITLIISHPLTSLFCP